ncbi:septum formation inhibitor Maf [candidate division KSB1 bacterium]|nr:septum formation inhibitor Maf [candidate division KSB1 bacterium]
MSLFDRIHPDTFVLASASPRRAQLLSLIGLPFSIKPSRVDEDQFLESDPQKHVLLLSLHKARDVAAGAENSIVIGADTIVVLDSKILGKPQNSHEAYSMLKALSGKVHRVYTGFSLIDTSSGNAISDYEMTKVYFRTLEDFEIKRYIETKSPMDKAGAYGIQDLSAVFVRRIEGCFYNVVGFPLAKFYKTLREFTSSHLSNDLKHHHEQ